MKNEGFTIVPLNPDSVNMEDIDHSQKKKRVFVLTSNNNCYSPNKLLLSNIRISNKFKERYNNNICKSFKYMNFKKNSLYNKPNTYKKIKEKNLSLIFKYNNTNLALPTIKSNRSKKYQSTFKNKYNTQVKQNTDTDNILDNLSNKNNYNLNKRNKSNNDKPDLIHYKNCPFTGINYVLNFYFQKNKRDEITARKDYKKLDKKISKEFIAINKAIDKFNIDLEE